MPPPRKKAGRTETNEWSCPEPRPSRFREGKVGRSYAAAVAVPWQESCSDGLRQVRLIRNHDRRHHPCRSVRGPSHSPACEVRKTLSESATTSRSAIPTGSMCRHAPITIWAWRTGCHRHAGATRPKEATVESEGLGRPRRRFPSFLDALHLGSTEPDDCPRPDQTTAKTGLIKLPVGSATVAPLRSEGMPVPSGQ